MKLFILTVSMIATCFCVHSQQIIFSDSSFQKAIFQCNPSIDLNDDGLIQVNEAAQVKSLSLKGHGLTSIQDIQRFPNLKVINASGNNLAELRLEGLDSLEELSIGGNKLTILELKGLLQLKKIQCEVNLLKELSIKNLPNLETLRCSENQLTNLDVSSFSRLKYLITDNNKLHVIDVSHNPELIQIVIDNNELASIDIRQNAKLEVHIMYIDEGVVVIGTPEQMKIPTGRKGTTGIPSEEKQLLIDKLMEVSRYEIFFNQHCALEIKREAEKKQWDDAEVEKRIAKVNFAKFKQYTIDDIYSSLTIEQLNASIKLYEELNSKGRYSIFIMSNNMLESNLNLFVKSNYLE